MSQIFNYQECIDRIYNEIMQLPNEGALPTYIPELEEVNPNQFGVSVITHSRQKYRAGDSGVLFSAQSIIKVFTLTMAYNIVGDDLWQRVDVEPSGTSYNSLVQLEDHEGIPRNPFMNAGAMVICDVLISHLKNPMEELLEFISFNLKEGNIHYNQKVADSEKSIGYRNTALCNFIKSYGNIENSPSDVLDFYFKMCAIEMNCENLAESALYLAIDEFKNRKGERVITDLYAKRINALMQTCGFYDESGEFSFRVGIPGKSGVGGGILAIHPERYSIAVWSPKLNSHGNSFRALEFLERFTTQTKSSIF